MKYPNYLNKEAGFKSFGEELRAVYDVASPGRKYDERLKNLAEGTSEGVPSDGGFLVETAFATDLMCSLYSSDAILSKVTRMPVSTFANGIKINGVAQNSRANGSRWGGIQTYWENEAAEIASSKPSFNQIELKLNKLTGLCYATDELLEDVPALGEVIRTAFIDEFSFRLTDKILYGSGTGEPLGIFNSPALVTVAKKNDQTEIITAENLLNMLVACDNKKGKAEWYINQELLPYLMTLKIGNTPIFLQGNSLSEEPYSTLLGHKINIIEQAAAPGDKGDIILADFSQYAIAEKYNAVKITESIHVRFVYDESVFRFVYRVDGQPLVTEAVTPYKGKIAKSPFVTLEARNVQEDAE